MVPPDKLVESGRAVDSKAQLLPERLAVQPDATIRPAIAPQKGLVVQAQAVAAEAEPAVVTAVTAGRWTATAVSGV